MPPNTTEVPGPSGVEEGRNLADRNAKPSTSEPVENDAETSPVAGLRENIREIGTTVIGVLSLAYKILTVLTSINLLAHILIGAVVAISLLYAFRGGLPLTATPLHIVLCVLGYVLLMGQAILTFGHGNGWSLHLRRKDKRIAHIILQVSGSALAITGTFIKILDKEEHWTTLHGKFGLVALVFTSVSLVNGVATFIEHQRRRFLLGSTTKLGHVILGTAAFSAACVTLCLGFAKNSFRSWISDAIANTAISFTTILAFIVILSPIVTLFIKSRIRALLNTQFRIE